VISEVARRHGLNPQQLFGWRPRLPDAVKGSAASFNATPAFVPAIVEDEPRSSAAPALPAAVVAMGGAGVDPAPIEIALGGVIVRVLRSADDQLTILGPVPCSRSSQQAENANIYSHFGSGPSAPVDCQSAFNRDPSYCLI
jgi:transposase